METNTAQAYHHQLDPNSDSSDFMSNTQQSPQDFCLLCLETPLTIPNFISRTSAQLIINFLDLQHDPDVVSLLAASSYCTSCFSTLEMVIELLSTLLTLKESLITKIVANLDSRPPKTSSRLQNLLIAPRRIQTSQPHREANNQDIENDQDQEAELFNGIKIKSERELMDFDETDDYDSEGELVINENEGEEDDPATYVRTEYSNGSSSRNRRCHPCHECLTVFPDLSQLLQHVKTIHGDEDGSVDIRQFQGLFSKPPFSLSQLIVQAISSSPAKESTLQGIYSFINDNYAYYRCGERKKAWQNSIRHTLSLNPNFLKGADHGSCWRLNPEAEELLVEDAYREKSLLTSSSGRRKNSVEINQPMQLNPLKPPKKSRAVGRVQDGNVFVKDSGEAPHSSPVFQQHSQSPPKRKSNIPKRFRANQSLELPLPTLPTMIPGIGSISDINAGVNGELPSLPFEQLPLPLLTAPLENPTILEGLSFSTFLKVIKTNSILNQYQKQQQEKAAGLSGQSEDQASVPKTRTYKKRTPNGEKRGRGRPPGSGSGKTQIPPLPSKPISTPDRKSQPHRKRLKYDNITGQPVGSYQRKCHNRTPEFRHECPADLPNYMDSMQQFIESALGKSPIPQSTTSTSTSGPIEESESHSESPTPAQLDECNSDEDHEEVNESSEQLIDFSKIKVENEAE